MALNKNLIIILLVIVITSIVVYVEITLPLSEKEIPSTPFQMKMSLFRCKLLKKDIKKDESTGALFVIIDNSIVDRVYLEFKRDVILRRLNEVQLNFNDSVTLDHINELVYDYNIFIDSSFFRGDTIVTSELAKLHRRKSAVDIHGNQRVNIWLVIRESW